MNFKNLLKRTIVPCLVAGATILTSVSGLFNENMKAKAAYTLAMDTEIYYYIRNANSNKYLDVCGGGGNTYDSIIQYHFNGGKNQMFKLTKVANNEYSIRPAVNPNMAITLQNQKMSNTDGTDAYLYPANNSWMCQRFFINNASDEIHGSVEIATKASGAKRMLEVTNSSYDDCEQVQIWYRGTDRSNDNWFLEPATATYCVTADDLSSSGSIAANSIVNSFKNIGYNAKRLNLPSKTSVTDRTKISDIVVLHGHGSSVGMGWEDSNNNQVGIRLDNYEKGKYYYKEYFPAKVALHTSFVYIASCNSSELGEAIYNQGARCVIAFSDYVAGAEYFLRDMMKLIEKDPSLTIGEAVKQVKGTYSLEDRYINTSSPAHVLNMRIYGDQNIRLGKEY